MIYFLLEQKVTYFVFLLASAVFLPKTDFLLTFFGIFQLTRTASSNSGNNSTQFQSANQFVFSMWWFHGKTKFLHFWLTGISVFTEFCGQCYEILCLFHGKKLQIISVFIFTQKWSALGFNHIPSLCGAFTRFFNFQSFQEQSRKSYYFDFTKLSKNFLEYCSFTKIPDLLWFTHTSLEAINRATF